PRFEHDACGVGFVAESSAGPSARIVRLALEALAGLTHRGAIAGDARTGDGAGLAIPLAPGLLQRIVAEAGVPVAPNRPIAVGMAFLPSADPARGRARQLVEAAIAGEGLEPLGWRVVPVDRDVLGPSAQASAPSI